MNEIKARRTLAAQKLREQRVLGRGALRTRQGPCAVGVIAEQCLGLVTRGLRSDASREEIYTSVRRYLGTNTDPICQMNDCGASPAEIADWLESLP